MNHFAKIMQTLGAVGVALLVVTGYQGGGVQDLPGPLARHSLLAVAAAGFCLLPRFWTLAFLGLGARGRRRAGALQENLTARRLRRHAYLVSAVAMIALAAAFALAGSVVQHRLPPLAHGGAGLAALALQILALWVERRALIADAGEMARLDPPLAGGATAH